MVGIYSLTSPSQKVYIGQSWNIEKRIRHYRTESSCKQQIGISRSIAKHGYKSHTVVTLLELPQDIDQKILDEYEIFFIEQYKQGGIILLNMKGGGLGGKPGPEARAKMIRNRPKGFAPTLGKKFSAESKKRMSEAQKKCVRDPAILERARAIKLSMPVSDATKLKIRKRLAVFNYWNGKKHSEASKKKQSTAKLGNKINNKKVKRIDTGQVFDSLTDAANSIGVQMKTLSARICSNSKKPPLFTYDV